jgi:hypothetical protein
LIEIRFIRTYDIGSEIDLDRLESALARSYYTARANFLRIKPKSITIEDPPLTLHMHNFESIINGITYEFKVYAKIYEIGAISICFSYESEKLPEKYTFEELALIFANDDIIPEFFTSYLINLKEIISPHLNKLVLDPLFFEDYTIYFLKDISEKINFSVLLIGENIDFSTQMHEELLKNSLSYSKDDLAILSWGAALLKDTEIPYDLFDLIEYAIVQVLELRYYDRELSRKMEKMYDDLEHADKLTKLSRMRQYHKIMADLMELYANISEVFEKINNLIKVTEDIYYARVYETALRVLRSQQWSESVNRKIDVIYQNYSMLSEEVRIQHSNFLEWVIIILIALEFSLAIWHSIW